MNIASIGFRPRGLNLPAMIAAALIAGVGWVMAQPQQPNAGGNAAPAQPAAGAGAAAAATETGGGDLSLLDLFIKGGWFMYPIALCSVVAVTVILERAVSLRSSNVIPAGFLPSLSGVLRDPARDREAAINFCQSHNAPIARVVAAGLSKYTRGEQAIEKAIEDAGSIEVVRLRRNLRLLYTVIAISPLLGLVGTIAGMIDAFQVTAKVGTGKGELLADGIYKALVTTYAGLLVAIPATVAYHFFQGRIEKLVMHMNEVSTKFVEDLLSPGSGASASRAAAAAPRVGPAVPANASPVGDAG